MLTLPEGLKFIYCNNNKQVKKDILVIESPKISMPLFFNNNNMDKQAIIEIELQEIHKKQDTDKTVTTSLEK